MGKVPCPLRHGVIKIYKSRPMTFIGHPNAGVIIYGADSIVMSASDGVVQAVMNIGDVQAVMIRSDSLFYTYSELDTCILAKGQDVKAGQVMGYSSRKEIELFVSGMNGSYKHVEKFVGCKCRIMK